MIKYKTLESVSLFPSGVATIGGRIQHAPKCWQSQHCAGSRLIRKYKMGYKAYIGDRVATQM